MNAKNTIYGFCIVSIVIILGAISINYNLSPFFKDVETQIKEGNTIVMNGSIDEEKLSSLLITGGYLSDTLDAQFISKWYKEKIESGEALVNLGAINGKRFRIPADSINQGGEGLKTRYEIELENLGQDSLWTTTNKSLLKPVFGKQTDSTALIKVLVQEKQDKIWGIIPRLAKNVEGVTVRITEYTISKSNLTEKNEVKSNTLGYAITDKSGCASFYLPKGHSYSVLPIAKGYQYGQEKGTTDTTLIKNMEFEFSQELHKLRPFNQFTYKQLKDDKTLISRTPAEFKNALASDVAIFIISWLLVFAITSLLDKRQGGNTDSLLLLSLMAITGMGLLTLYGQMLPLTDIFYAHKMIDILSFSTRNFSGGFVIGCGLLVTLSRFNYLKLFQRYQSKWLTHLTIGNGSLVSLAPGLPFVFIAILLMGMLYFMGSGPEGSDAKVNLLVFQPSEVVKYLMVIFMAFFFYMKGDVIKTFGAKLTTLARRRYLFVISGVIITIAVICLLFLAMLKDMGPGVVILATFILLYSIARRDLPQLLLGIISYVVLVGTAYCITNITSIRVITVLAWFPLWIAYSWSKKRTIYESAIFFNIQVSLFLIGEHILNPILPSMAKRLANRTNMAGAGIFDNAVPQGDQIAQGLWGTASGGLTGMGLGGGSSYFIPAGHTDLIMNSLGEQMGWIGILIVVICFFILISRTIVAAQYSGHKFTFYLCSGIGLITGVQFLFIALGCVGAIPLSGVPVPFMSYSGTSIVMALAAFGIVISISRHRGNAEALKSFIVNERIYKDNIENVEAKSLTKNLFAGMVLMFVGCACVVGINGYYQLLVSSKTQIRPAKTATNTGLRVLEYNPRIKQVLGQLNRGNIYDRNGKLLATSDKAELYSAQLDSIKELLNIKELKNKRLKRYYPFGSNTVFMVGDLNRPDVYTNFSELYPIGYFAENGHAHLLQGLDIKTSRDTIKSPEHKINRFVKSIRDSISFTTYDYTALLPALSTSIYQNPWIEEYNKSRAKRDIYLTIDAVLQAKLQNEMNHYIKSHLKQHSDLRASVVVLDASNGDLLTSANYPLPEADSIVMLRELKLDRGGDVPSDGRKGAPITEKDLGLTFQSVPGSTAKVMTAMAGLRKMGAAAFNQGFEIKPYMNIEKPGEEPNTTTRDLNRNGGRKTYMDNAIKHSSNCYFIMSLCENDLYAELGPIYWNVGARLSSFTPYIFNYKDISDSTKVNNKLKTLRTEGLQIYRSYMNKTGLLPENTAWKRGGKDDTRMGIGQEFIGIAWGQGPLQASPLNMARVAGIVGNGGVFVPTRYLLSEPKEDGIRILDSSLNDLLALAMNGESSKSKHSFPAQIKAQMGGKTGTPQRKKTIEVKSSQNKVISKEDNVNDGWYICYIRDAKDGRTLSIAVRLERLKGKANSAVAVEFMRNVVLPALKGKYIDY